VSPGRRAAFGLLAGLALAAPTVAYGQAAPSEAGPAAVVDQFLQNLRRGRHAALGALLPDRVRTGEGETLRRDQVILLYQGYTLAMFGPLRSFACDAPETNAVTCRLRFQSRSLRERYTVEAGLISGIEILPWSGEGASQ